ncbi:hypothetical protein [Aeromonas caviae]|uniref:hypothetical protein n=1 Tax=Aeromonas caviae TaxID=648 RepID=UPI00385CFBC0
MSTTSHHPYSYHEMKTAIEYAKLAGSALYHDKNNHKLPPVKITNKDGELRFSSEINIEHYLPFNIRDESYPLTRANYTPPYYSMKECSFGEFFINELYQQPFHVVNKETGISSPAIFAANVSKEDMGFVILNEKAVVSMKDLSRLYEVTPDYPSPSPQNTPSVTLTDDMFWKVVDGLKWDKDHNSIRAENELYNKLPIDMLSAISEKASFFARQFYSRAYNTFRDLREDTIMDAMYHVVYSGKEKYEKVMGSTDELRKVFGEKLHEGLRLPLIRQQNSYPYAQNLIHGEDLRIKWPEHSQFGDMRLLRIKADAIQAIHAIQSIDFDEVAPKRAREIAPMLEESLMRLGKIADGDLKGAYQNFDKNAYNRLSSNHDAKIGARVSNMISDIMANDGIDFKTAKWDNDKLVVEKNKTSSHAHDMGMGM